MKDKMGRWLTFLCLAVCMLAFPVVVHAEETIIDGIYIGDQNVAGMNWDQAQDVVEQQVDAVMSAKVTFRMPEDTFTTSVESLGYTWTNPHIAEEALSLGRRGNIVSKYKLNKDLEHAPKVYQVEGTVDYDQIMEILEDNCVKYNKPVRNMGLEMTSTGFRTVQGYDGYRLDVEKSATAIEETILNEWTGGDITIDMVVDTIATKGSEEELSEITDVLGAGSTTYSSSSDSRKQNISTGMSKISGVTLYPGDSFSFLEHVVPFDEENGYATAPSYMSGEVIESYGGGICQVSTTLYLALLRAELQIDQRSSHSMMVHYVKPAMDAAIAEGSKDFVFTNNTDAPVFIYGEADGSELSFTIYGKEYRDADREVTYTSEVLEETSKGTKAVLWKTVRENGTVETTEVNVSEYRVAGTTPSADD